MEHDRIALLQMRYGPAHFLDPASVLVAEGVRQLGVEGSLQATLHDVNVRPANPGSGDPDDDVVRIDDFRLRHFHQLDGLLVSHHLCRSHRDVPRCGWRIVVTALPPAAKAENPFYIASPPLDLCQACHHYYRRPEQSSVLSIPDRPRSRPSDRAVEL